jgi:hypothetical protein
MRLSTIARIQINVAAEMLAMLITPYPRLLEEVGDIFVLSRSSRIVTIVIM